MSLTGTTPSFGTPIITSFTGSAYEAVAGQLNGDTNLDLVVLNSVSGSSTNLSILLGNGNGTFSTTAPNVSVGSRAYAVVLGDFNGDQKLDLAVTNNSSSGQLSIFLGNNSGTFTPASVPNISVGSYPGAITVGDFNGDGKTDLAFINVASSQIEVLTGNGNGTFGSATTYSVGGLSPTGIVAADFNGDGKLDLAVANGAYDNSGNKDNNTISILMNNGTGGFNSAVSITVGSGPSSLAVGDFNGDGKPDLVVANGGNNSITVLLNNGSGGFSVGTTISLQGTPFTLAVGDFNGDGKTDFAVGETNGDVSVFEGNGNGTFATPVNTTIGTTPIVSLIAGDFTSDNKTDLAVLNLGGSSVEVLPNTTLYPPTFTVPSSETAQGNVSLSVTGISISDINTTGSGPFSLTLSDTTGILTLGSTTGLTFVNGSSNTSHDFTVTGSLSNLNADLSSLSYINSTGATQDTITLNVIDEGTGTPSDSTTVPVTISPLLPPTLSAPSSQNANTNVAAPISGISISDTNANPGPFELTLFDSTGTLTLGSTTGLTFANGSNGSKNFTVTGSLSNLNTALSTLSYESTSATTDTINLTVTDQETGANSTLTASKAIAVTVTNPVAPTLSAPSSETSQSNVSLSVSGISVSDSNVNPGPFKLTLSDTTGILTLGSTTGLTFANGSNGSSNLTVTGSLSNLNTALSALSYKNSTSTTTDTINLTVTDQETGANSTLIATKTIAVTNLVPPTLTVPSSQNANTNVAVTVPNISISDPNANPGTLQLILSDTTGILTLGSTTGLTFANGSSNGSKNFTVTGSLSNLNNALSTLNYKNTSATTDTINLTVTDEEAGANSTLTANEAIAVTVTNPVAPTLSAPSSETSQSNVSLSVSGISISDTNVNPGPFQLTLSDNTGILTLGSTTGLTFANGSSNGSKNFTVTGSLSNLNAALSTLSYINSTSITTDTISLTVTDQETGANSTLTASKTIAVTNPVAPTLSAPSSQNANTGVAVPVSGISISDTNTNPGPFQLILSDTTGILTLGSTTGLTFANGSSNGSKNFTVTGSLSNLNNALSTLSYESTSATTDTINLTVTDQETGANSTLTASKAIAVTVTNPVAPTLSAPSSQNANTGVAVPVSGISISDTNTNPGPFQLILSDTTGILTLGSTTGLAFTNGSNGSSNFTVTGSLSNLNNALSTLSYENSTSNTTDTISLNVIDQETGANSTLTANQTIAVNVTNPVAPTLTVPSSEISQSNVSLSVTGISISDTNVNPGPFKLILSDNTGILTLGSTTGLTFANGNNGSSNLTVTGSLSNLNTALSALSYKNSTSNTTDTISLNVIDQETGANSTLTASKTIAVTNLLPPTLTVPSSQNANTNVAVTVPNISISDPNATPGPFELTLSDNTGTLTLGSTTGLTFANGSSNGSNNLTVTGSLSNLNTALSTLSYKNTSATTDTINLNVTDEEIANSTLTASKAIAVTVTNPVAPTLSVPSSETSQSNVSLSVSGINVSDSNVNPGPFKLTLSDNTGILTLGSTTGLTFTNGSNGSNNFTVTGALSNLNTALSALSYKNITSTTTDTISLTVTDQETGANSTLTASKAIAVTNLLPPTLTVPSSQNANTNVVAPVSGISISDPNANPGPFKLTLSDSTGTLTLGTTTGLTLSGNSTGLVIATGSLSNLNNALSTLSYENTSATTDTINLNVTDQETGANSTLTAIQAIAVTVTNPVAPTLSAPSSETSQSNVSLPVTGISIGDTNVNPGPFQLTLSDTTGILTLGATTGLTFANGSSNGSSNFTVTGSLSNLNAALSALSYKNSTSATQDSISLNVTDEETGANSTLTASTTIAVTNLLPPTLTATTIETAQGNVSLSVTGINISDPNANSGPFQLTLSDNTGILTLGSTTGLTFANGSSNGSNSFTVTGSLSNLNNALNTLSYKNITSATQDTINLTVTDQETGANSTLTASKAIAVTHLLPPTLSAPSSQNANTNVAAPVSGISISDPNANSGPFELTLSDNTGTLTLGSTTGLTFANGSSNGSSNLIVTGSLSNLNNALSTLSYENTSATTDTINLNVTDQETGANSTLTAIQAIAVNVTNPVPPTLTVPSSQFNVGTNVSLSVPGIQISDTNVNPGPFKLTLSDNTGILTLGAITGLTFANGSSNGSSNLTVTGSLSNLNAALSTLSYKSTSVTTDTINLTVTDQETGANSSNPLEAQANIPINVKPFQASSNNTLDQPPSSLVFNFAANTQNLSEVGVFAVNNDSGSITTANGTTLLPGQPGYVEAALSQAQILYGFDPTSLRSGSYNPTSQYTPTSNYLGFYYISNSTSGQVLSTLNPNQATANNVFFNFSAGNSDGANHLQITSTGTNQFQLAWNGTGSTSQTLLSAAPGSAGQGQPTIQPIISVTSGTFTTSIVGTSDALFNDFVGFYPILNSSGTITYNGKTLNPGDAGYAAAAVAEIISGLTFNKNTGSVNTNIAPVFNSADQPWQSSQTVGFTQGSNGSLSGLFAPVLIANGTPSQFESQNPNNTPPSSLSTSSVGANPLAYFAYVSANPSGDTTDHIRSLPGALAFKDYYQGGDLDYNDVVIHFSTTPTSTAAI